MAKFDELHRVRLKEAARVRREDIAVGRLIRYTDRALFATLLYQLDQPRTNVLMKMLARIEAQGLSLGHFL